MSILFVWLTRITAFKHGLEIAYSTVNPLKQYSFVEMGSRHERHPVNGVNVEPSAQIKCHHHFPLAISGKEERHEVTIVGDRERRSGFDIANWEI